MGCNLSQGIDLHIHSTASDGTLSASEILALACKLGLGAISITDHDTIAGSRQALAIGVPAPLEFLTGIELSARTPRNAPIAGSLHILGYGLQPDDPELRRVLSKLQQARQQRLPQMLARLNGLGFDLTWEDVRREVGEGQPGRPHLARSLLKKGIVGSIDEAFERFLASGRPAYVEKYRLPADQAIALIRRAGGIAVLAHPYLLKICDRRRFEALVTDLKDAGLEGIEVFYPQHPPAETSYYARLAEHLDLLKTGGTDFHGDLTPKLQMGTADGGFFVPGSIYHALCSRLAGRHSVL